MYNSDMSLVQYHCVHAPTDKNDDKNSFYGELRQVFNHFPKYHTKVLKQK